MIFFFFLAFELHGGGKNTVKKKKLDLIQYKYMRLGSLTRTHFRIHVNKTRMYLDFHKPTPFSSVLSTDFIPLVYVLAGKFNLSLCWRLFLSPASLGLRVAEILRNSRKSARKSPRKTYCYANPA